MYYQQSSIIYYLLFFALLVTLESQGTKSEYEKIKIEKRLAEWIFYNEDGPLSRPFKRDKIGNPIHETRLNQNSMSISNEVYHRFVFPNDKQILYFKSGCNFEAKQNTLTIVNEYSGCEESTKSITFQGTNALWKSPLFYSVANDTFLVFAYSHDAEETDYVYFCRLFPLKIIFLLKKFYWGLDVKTRFRVDDVLLDAKRENVTVAVTRQFYNSYLRMQFIFWLYNNFITSKTELCKTDINFNYLP